MDQKYGEFVGVDNLHAAVILEDSEQNYVCEKPEYLAPTAEISGEAETDSSSTFYDNKAASTYVSEGATNLTVTISGLDAKTVAKYLGKHYDQATGRVLDDGEPNPPEVALSFRYNKGKSGHRYYQYLKGTFSGGAEEAATKTNSIEVKTYQLTLTAVATTYQWDINGDKKSLKRIFGDTTDEAFNPEGWFNQVQTPNVVVKPSDLVLSSSVPTDEDTGIAVDVSPALTFNNKISSYNITVINPTTLNVIAAAISLDDTRKIITINPESDLDAATGYAIIVSNVVDIYGQSLSNIVINFTTA